MKTEVKREEDQVICYTDTLGEPAEEFLPGVTKVKCCGYWMECPDFTNTCERCGTDYNWAGQTLAPREHWGEETGEHWSECY